MLMSGSETKYSGQPGCGYYGYYKDMKMKATLILGFLALLCPHMQAEPSRPNVLVIMVDDLGYGDLSFYGATDLKTPHIDRLMSEGLRFNQFYANCCVCSPTRAALFRPIPPRSSRP